MNPVSREVDDESKRLMEEYLDKGGKITYCEPMARTENIEVKGGFYGRKPKKKKEE